MLIPFRLGRPDTFSSRLGMFDRVSREVQQIAFVLKCRRHVGGWASEILGLALRHRPHLRPKQNGLLSIRWQSQYCGVVSKDRFCLFNRNKCTVMTLLYHPPKVHPPCPNCALRCMAVTSGPHNRYPSRRTIIRISSTGKGYYAKTALKVFGTTKAAAKQYSIVLNNLGPCTPIKDTTAHIKKQERV